MLHNLYSRGQESLSVRGMTSLDLVVHNPYKMLMYNLETSYLAIKLSSIIKGFQRLYSNTMNHVREEGVRLDEAVIPSYRNPQGIS